MPYLSSACTHSIAVKPAVPIAMASSSPRPAGSGTSQSDFTRAFCAKPPRCPSPTPKPVSTTLSPGLNSGEEDFSTTPAKSMPGISGKRRAMGALPVMASPSL